MWAFVKGSLPGDPIFCVLSLFTIEKRYIRKDGNIIWINLTGSIIRSENREPLYFVGMIEDISERKKMKEKMRHKGQVDFC